MKRQYLSGAMLAAAIIPMLVAAAALGFEISYDNSAGGAFEIVPQAAHAQTTPKEIKIGALVQYTAEVNDTANLAAIKLSVADINADPAINTKYSITLVELDVTEHVASGNLAGIIPTVRGAITDDGISYFVGPSSSPMLGPIKQLSDSIPSTLFVSQGSSAPVLLLPDGGGILNLSEPDGIFRLVPGEAYQAQAHTDLVEREDKDAVIVIVRDEWEGLVDLLISDAFGPRLDRPIVTYPKALTFGGDLAAATAGHAQITAGVNARLGDLIEEHGADRVAIIFIGYPLDFEYHAKAIASAGSTILPHTYNVDWYGTSTFVGIPGTLRDADVAAFAAQVDLTGTRYTVEPNSVNSHLCSRLLDQGMACDRYATEMFASYDAVGLIVDSVIAKDDRRLDPQRPDLTARELVLSVVVGDELERQGRQAGDGALGVFELNVAGDLTPSAPYSLLRATTSDNGGGGSGHWILHHHTTARICR